MESKTFIDIRNNPKDINYLGNIYYSFYTPSHCFVKDIILVGDNLTSCEISVTSCNSFFNLEDTFLVKKKHFLKNSDNDKKRINLFGNFGLLLTNDRSMFIKTNTHLKKIIILYSIAEDVYRPYIYPSIQYCKTPYSKQRGFLTKYLRINATKKSIIKTLYKNNTSLSEVEKNFLVAFS